MQSSISLPPSFRSLSTAPPVDGVVSLVEMIVNEEDGGDRIRARDITTDSRQWRALTRLCKARDYSENYKQDSNPSKVGVRRDEESNQKA